jgi:Transposase, Mutator family
MALERMLAGLSTRRYPVALEPVGARTEQAATSTSRSAVSWRFVAQTQTALAQLLDADLSGLGLVALMIDGVHFGEHCCVVALGIGIDGTKHPLSLVEGSTENTTLVTELIVGLRERGLDVTRPILVVLDGPKRCTVRCWMCSTARCWAAANSTRSVTWPIIFRRSCARWSPRGCGGLITPTPRWPPKLNWVCWPRSWTGPIPARRQACAKAWPRR